MSSTAANGRINSTQTSSETILSEQVIRIKRGRMNRFGFEPAWNAYFEFYLTTKFFGKPLLQFEDVTFHLYLRKNLNDYDPEWKMPSIPFMKRQFGMGQARIEKIIERLTKAHLLTKVSGKRRGEKEANVTNEYILSDPIPTLEEFLLVAKDGQFDYPLREEWHEYRERLEADGEENGGQHFRLTTPLPKTGKGALPEMSEGALPKTGKHKHTSYKQQTSYQQRTTRARDDHNNNSSDSTTPSDVVVAYPPASSTQETVEEEPHRHPENAGAIQLSLAVAEPPIPLDPPSPTPNQAAEQALLAIGIGKTVAQRLATRYRAERILEKIEFLAFLQAERPDAIENPRGWLRRAIEEDYGAPDGYRSAAERAQQAAEEAAQEEAWHQREQQQQAFADWLTAQQAAFRQRLTEQYGTAEADEWLWQEVLLEFKHGQPDLYSLFSSAQILSTDDERVQLGFTHELSMLRLQHPGTLTALKRALKGIAKRPLEVATVLLSEEAMGHTGVDEAATSPA